VIYQGIMPDLTAPCTRRCVATSLKVGNVGSCSARNRFEFHRPELRARQWRCGCARQDNALDVALMPSPRAAASLR
jgi:hypothetical protein